MNLPADAPVMVLPNALLFPRTLLPLRIFEERYRQMLLYCLHHQRMFCVALLKQGVPDANSADDFHHVAGLGLIRACVANPDGTSNLILQGLARVKFINFIQDAPFYIAQIRELRSQVPNLIEAEALGAKVIELCARLQKRGGFEVADKLSRDIAHMSNPEALSDIVTNTFVRDPFRRQNILEQPIVSERLRLLIVYLQGEIG
jgi:Lon protease-like protein